MLLRFGNSERYDYIHDYTLLYTIYCLYNDERLQYLIKVEPRNHASTVIMLVWVGDYWTTIKAGLVACASATGLAIVVVRLMCEPPVSEPMSAYLISKLYDACQ